MAKNHVAWRGALDVGGFPVNIALYARVKKQRTESFRTIAPSGQPMKSGRPIDPGTGEVYDSSLNRKGYEVAKGQFAILTEEAIEQINSGHKTRIAKAAQFAPVDTIAWDLAIDRFKILPDDKVPGSDQSVNIVWNGLKGTGTAYISQVSLRGGHDAILAVYADATALWAALLPFEHELYDTPTHSFEPDDKAAALFAQVIEQQSTVAPFDHSAFKSEYAARRKDAIEKVIAGENIELPTEPEAPSDVPDLMALLQASVAKNVEDEVVAA